MKVWSLFIQLESSKAVYITAIFILLFFFLFDFCKIVCLCVCVSSVTQLCWTICDPMDCSPCTGRWKLPRRLPSIRILPVSAHNGKLCPSQTCGVNSSTVCYPQLGIFSHNYLKCVLYLNCPLSPFQENF